MKISILLIKHGIEFAREVITSPCTAEAFARLISKTVTAGLISIPPKSKSSEGRQLPLLLTEPVSKAEADDEAVVVLSFEDEDGEQLIVKTSSDHIIACDEGFSPTVVDSSLILSSAELAEDWVRNRYFYLPFDLEPPIS